MRASARLKRVVGAAAAALLLGLAGCSGGQGTPTLTWYFNPDDGGSAKMAADCSAQSGGRYTIETALLPKDAPGQREQLVRRLASHDSSIDIMNIDPVYFAESANAGFLAPVPEKYKKQFTQGVFPSSVEASTWQGTLMAAPLRTNAQLLWYRKSVARKAGLDMSKPVTWDQIIDAAAKEKSYVSAQGVRAESLTVWINAMIESAGGRIVENPSAGEADQVKLHIDSAAGRKAAAIMHKFGQTGVGGPQFNNATENLSQFDFQADKGGFMVNWPFIYPAIAGAVEEGTLDKSVLDDIGWTLYPRVDADKQAKPPIGGINLGVGAFSKHKDLAFEAESCLTEPKRQAAYFVSGGIPPAAESAFDDADVKKNFPAAATIKRSLSMAAPRPLTPYYNEITGTIQKSWHPAGAVAPATTPAASQQLTEKVLRGERLL